MRLALRAVVFDYGMVLTEPPDEDAHEALVRITGLAPEQLDKLYWADRAAFDSGALTGQEFWRGFAREIGLTLSEPTIEELVHWDARMWMAINPAMLAWQSELKKRGILTAIVSNMGDTVHAEMEREFEWLGRFDVLVWSYELRVTKPDPAIYEYMLEKLGTRAEETMFIDDRNVNVDAAVAMGMKGIVFTTVERLREDLVASGLENEVPLPE